MKQTNLRNLGILLIVIGLILVIYGIVGSTLILCPAGGCSSDYIWWRTFPFLVSFYLGVPMIIVGIILLVASRRVKTDKSKAR